MATTKRKVLGGVAAAVAGGALGAGALVLGLPVLGALGVGAAGIAGAHFLFRPGSTAGADSESALSGPDQVAELTFRGEELLSAMQEKSTHIDKIAVRSSVHEICRLTEAILDDIKKDPRDLKAAKKFLNYHLPSTLTIIEKYVNISSKEVLTAEMQAALDKVEGMLRSIQAAFETQLNKLYENDVMELDMEMKVLEKTFELEGVHPGPAGMLTAGAAGSRHGRSRRSRLPRERKPRGERHRRSRSSSHATDPLFVLREKYHKLAGLVDRIEEYTLLQPVEEVLDLVEQSLSHLESSGRGHKSTRLAVDNYLDTSIEAVEAHLNLSRKSSLSRAEQRAATGHRESLARVAKLLRGQLAKSKH